MSLVRSLDRYKSRDKIFRKKAPRDRSVPALVYVPSDGEARDHFGGGVKVVEGSDDDDESELSSCGWEEMRETTSFHQDDLQNSFQSDTAQVFMYPPLAAHKSVRYDQTWGMMTATLQEGYTDPKRPPPLEESRRATV